MINFSNSKNSNENLILNISKFTKEYTENKNLIKKEEKKEFNVKHNQNNNFMKYDEKINEFF